MRLVPGETLERRPFSGENRFGGVLQASEASACNSGQWTIGSHRVTTVEWHVAFRVGLLSVRVNPFPGYPKNALAIPAATPGSGLGDLHYRWAKACFKNAFLGQTVRAVPGGGVAIGCLVTGWSRGPACLRPNSSREEFP